MSTPDYKGFKLALNDAARQLQIRRNDFTERFKSQDTAHPNCWDDYGYEESLEFANFYSMYKRNPFAAAVIDRPVDKCWQSSPWFMTDQGRKGADFNTWERELEAFIEKHDLINTFKELDRMQSIGQYAALVIEARDGKRYSEKIGKIRPNQVESFKIVSEAMLDPALIDNNPKSTRYGLPITLSLIHI